MIAPPPNPNDGFNQASSSIYTNTPTALANQQPPQQLLEILDLAKGSNSVPVVMPLINNSKPLAKEFVITIPIPVKKGVKTYLRRIQTLKALQDQVTYLTAKNERLRSDNRRLEGLLGQARYLRACYEQE